MESSSGKALFLYVFPIILKFLEEANSSLTCPRATLSPHVVSKVVRRGGSILPVPHVQVGADKDGRKGALDSLGVDWPVEMDAVQGSFTVHQLKTLGRLDDSVTEGFDELAVRRREDGILEDALNGRTSHFLCGGARTVSIEDGAKRVREGGVESPRVSTNIRKAMSWRNVRLLVSQPPSGGSKVPIPRQTARDTGPTVACSASRLSSPQAASSSQRDRIRRYSAAMSSGARWRSSSARGLLCENLASFPPAAASGWRLFAARRRDLGRT